MDTLTVGKLIELLSEYPSDMPVCRMGHFGEPHALSSSDFDTATAYYPITDRDGWPDMAARQVAPFTVLAVTLPGIGPDPD